jgi:hypothetical protein
MSPGGAQVGRSDTAVPFGRKALSPGEPWVARELLNSRARQGGPACRLRGNA